MIEFAEPTTTTDSTDILRIDERTDVELDTLPYGVIALDEEGTILRYNLYESRFARLDRNQVLGRDFFGEVARCTRGEAFEGRFRHAVQSGGTGSVARFDYIFDFAFGAQEVGVEIVRAASVARWYLLINRRKVRGPRPDRHADLGIAQRALAPAEKAHGVRRDPMERRVVEVPWAFFASLRATCDRIAPTTWQLFCTEWGVQLGRRFAIDLETTSIENTERRMGDLAMTDLAELISRRLREDGWGRAQFDFAAVREGVITIRVERSVLAEAAPRVQAVQPPDLTDLACPLLGGMLGALMTHVAGRRLAAREVACASRGADACSFVLTAYVRRAAVDAALGTGARGVESIREALRRAPAKDGDE